MNDTPKPKPKSTIDVPELQYDELSRVAKNLSALLSAIEDDGERASAHMILRNAFQLFRKIDLGLAGDEVVITPGVLEKAYNDLDGARLLDVLLLRWEADAGTEAVASALQERLRRFGEVVERSIPVTSVLLQHVFDDYGGLPLLADIARRWSVATDPVNVARGLRQVLARYEETPEGNAGDAPPPGTGIDLDESPHRLAAVPLPPGDWHALEYFRFSEPFGTSRELVALPHVVDDQVVGFTIGVSQQDGDSLEVRRIKGRLINTLLRLAAARRLKVKISKPTEWTRLTQNDSLDLCASLELVVDSELDALVTQLIAEAFHV